MKKLSLIGACSILLLVGPSAALAQKLQVGIGGVIGTSGLGVEGDVAVRRVGAFARFQGTLSASTRMVAPRVYVIAEQELAFYVATGLVQLLCNPVALGGTATNCDGEWHDAWAILGGVQFGSRRNGWSLSIDGGPFMGARDVPGLRDWTFDFGLRFRP